MRASELKIEDLFCFESKGGVMTFAGERVLLLDAVAMGLLRRQLIDLLGQRAARGVLTRFGYSHGWRTAESMREALAWDDLHQWRVAGGRLHMLQGLVEFEPDPESGAFAGALWHASYEAEQHLLHVGLSEEPVCWSLTGFASGYLSKAFGQPIYCVEESCVGRGDAVCRMVGRTLSEWGERAAEFLLYYEQATLSASLESVRQALVEAEGRLQRHRTMSPRSMSAQWAASEGLIARSASMTRLIERARRLAMVNVTVLVTGESGVGKERLARLIHAASPRAQRAFVAVNCGAIHESLLESELFGHVRGAFSGADRDRVGLFEAANGGTLFLDEVGEISPAMQVKLLRALEERAIRRVGENKTRPVDVRIVAATNRDMRAQVASGGVREDFFYRLRVVELAIKPLRERRDDVLPLAHRHLDELRVSFGRPELRGFSRAAIRSLLAHPWPGNVRELRNAVEHAVALAQGDLIEPIDLPEEVCRALAEHPGQRLMSSPPPPGARRHGADPAADPSAAQPSPASPELEVSGAGMTLAQVERAHILRTLERVDGHRERAAAALGISAATLYRRLKAYGATS